MNADTEDLAARAEWLETGIIDLYRIVDPDKGESGMCVSTRNMLNQLAEILDWNLSENPLGIDLWYDCPSPGAEYSESKDLALRVKWLEAGIRDLYRITIPEKDESESQPCISEMLDELDDVFQALASEWDVYPTDPD